MSNIVNNKNSRTKSKEAFLRKGNLEVKLSVFIPTEFTDVKHQDPLNLVMNRIFGEIVVEGLKRERELVANEIYRTVFGKKHATYPCFFAYAGAKSREDVFSEITKILRDNMKSLVEEEVEGSVVREIISGIQIKMQ